MTCGFLLREVRNDLLLRDDSCAEYNFSIVFLEGETQRTENRGQMSEDRGHRTEKHK